MELIQKEIRTRLQDLYRNNKVPHAMLFAGPRGCGKLHIAIEFAKLLLCESSNDAHPCGECPSCKMSKDLFHPDLLFFFPTVRKDGNDKKLSMDYLQTFVEYYKEHPFFSLDEWTNAVFAENKMPNIYNDEAVFLLEKVANKPLRKKRVIIFLCPEIMGQACANRLLKTIEEPDGENNFIFISDNPNDILETIFSRLQRIYFPPLTDADIKRLIPNITNNTAKISRGDMCMALQLVNNNEEAQRYHDYFKFLMRSAYKRDVKEIDELVNGKEGLSIMSRKELIAMLECFTDIVREVQMVHLGVEEASYMSDDMKEFVVHFSPFFYEERIPKFLDIISDAITSISRNCQAKVVLFDMCMKILLLMPLKQ